MTETLFVCDTKNDAIRSVDLASGIVQTLSLQSINYIGLIAPIDICMAYGEYDYDEEEGCSSNNDDNSSKNGGQAAGDSSNESDNSESEDDRGRGRGNPFSLEGIQD